MVCTQGADQIQRFSRPVFLGDIQFGWRGRNFVPCQDPGVWIWRDFTRVHTWTNIRSSHYSLQRLVLFVDNWVECYLHKETLRWLVMLFSFFLEFTAKNTSSYTGEAASYTTAGPFMTTTTATEQKPTESRCILKTTQHPMTITASKTLTTQLATTKFCKTTT